MLSREAREWAAEIRAHDWSDAPYRVDRAGHQRDQDSDSRRSKDVLNDHETTRLRANVILVAIQVLGHKDPKFDALEFARAAGDTNFLTTGAIDAGTRREDGKLIPPGQWFSALTR